MNGEMQALARRAVACKGWRWLPGVLTQYGRAVETPGVVDEVRINFTAHSAPARLDPLPDLTDPATLGCLLALVREAWGDPTLVVEFRDSTVRPGWDGPSPLLPDTSGAWLPPRWIIVAGEVEVEALTEVHALVAALEAAP